MPLTQQQAESALMEAKSRNPNITKDQAKALLQELDNQLVSKTSTAKTGTWTPEEFGSLSDDDKIKRIGSLSPEERSQLSTGQQFATAPYRNVTKEKGGFQQGVETAGNVAEVGALTFGGILGGLLGGTKGSSFATGGVKAGTSTIREAYQNMVGRQDQVPLESAKQPLEDAAIAAGTDFILGSVFDLAGKAAGGVKNAVMKSSVGDIATAKTATLKKALLSMGKNGFEPADELIERGIVQTDWYTPTPGAKHPYKGRKIISEQMGVAEDTMMEAIKNSPVKNKAVVKKSELVSMSDDFASLVAEDTAASLADAKEISKNIIDEYIPQGSKLTPAKALELKRKLFSKTVKKNGLPYSTIEKNVKYRLASAINSSLKKAVPETAEGLAEQQKLFVIKEMLDAAYLKNYANQSRSVVGGLSSSELGQTANDVFQSALTFGFSPAAGVGVGVAKTPGIIKRMFGSPKAAMMASKEVPQAVKTAGTGAQKFLQSIGLQGVGDKK